MDEANLVDSLTARLGSRAAAEAASQAFADAVLAEVARGGRVSLTGFGVFDAGTSRKGAVSRQRLRFRAGSSFKALVNQGPSALPPAVTAISPKLRRPSSTKRRAARQEPLIKDFSATEPSGERTALVLNFQHYTVPAGVSLSAVLPQATPRCGIYVLHFDDGHRYVGQARNVLTRFGSHRRRWGDHIVGLDFAPAASTALNDLERRTIQRLERDGMGLYNSALVGLPMGESPLDLVIDRVEQEQWLDDPSATPWTVGGRPTVALKRPRVGKNYEALSSRPDYEGIRLALSAYLISVIPQPHETERRFWSITAMPSTNRSRVHHRLTAISVNNVETLVLMEVLEPHGWEMGGFINVYPDVVGRRADLPMKRNRYRTIGEVDRIFFAGWQGLLDLVLNDQNVVGAAQRTALGLMRKGRGMMAKYHDESLADDIFTVLGELEEE